MDTDNFKVYMKAKQVYIDIAKHFETAVNISNHDSGRLSLRGKKLKSYWINEGWVRGKIMT